MPKPSIAIIGAGIGGSTLGRCLAGKGIPARVYERASPSRRHNYAITLQASTCSRLTEAVGIDLATLTQQIGVRWPSGELSVPSDPFDAAGLRVHRQKLENLIQENLRVRWNSAVERIELGGDGNAEDPGEKRITLRLAGGRTARHSHVVCADGAHSPSRKLLLPDSDPDREPSVLPYVAINGKRLLSRKTFEELYAPAFRHARSPSISTRVGDALLQVDFFDFEYFERTVDISWIYSRKPRGPDDALYKPNRPPAAATDIPEEFFAEIQGLGLEEHQQPFREVFDAQKMREERLISWLMRTTQVSPESLRSLAAKGVYFIGDAVHAEPILGGEAANGSIVDALSLADWIEYRGVEKLPHWYARRCPEWKDRIAASKKRIDEMHS